MKLLRMTGKKESNGERTDHFYSLTREKKALRNVLFEAHTEL